VRCDVGRVHVLNIPRDISRGGSLRANGLRVKDHAEARRSRLRFNVELTACSQYPPCHVSIPSLSASASAQISFSDSIAHGLTLFQLVNVCGL